MNLIKYFAFCIVLGVVSCSSNTQQGPATASTTSTIKDGKTTIEAFKTAIAKVQKPQLVDVRTPKEYTQGHLEGALNINFNDPNFEQTIGQLNKSEPVFIYCQAGGRSGKAYQKMKKMGFSIVYDMEGGYGSWARRK